MYLKCAIMLILSFHEMKQIKCRQNDVNALKKIQVSLLTLFFTAGNKQWI